ncbi:MAG: TetR/AcrR family transcriptional regulator [Planctomycetota bacterium]|nr:MAG: TetR/AcrR family transcriptional regulator [Planctomycetota bacterium]
MATRNSTETRRRILDAAQELVLKQGFSATSIDQILDRVGITKGAFFYHYKTKNDLARALIDRYAQSESELLRDFMQRAERLSKDPLQQYLIFLGLFLEMAEGMDDPFPGCLFASYCYESGLFDSETMGVIAFSMLEWRHVLSRKLEEAVALHPPAMEFHSESLADMLTGIFEGAFIMARAMKEPKIFAQQLLHYKQYVELLFHVA